VSSPDPPGVRLPSVASRLGRAILWLVPMLILFVGVPALIQPILASHGVSSDLPLLSISVVGVLLAVLAAGRTFMRPTRWFGPLGIVSSALGIVYLLVVVPHATLTVPLGSSLRVTLGYGTVLLVATIIPALGLLSSMVTTAGDARRPNERLRLDYPARAG
jgi:hypothetical protein